MRSRLAGLLFLTDNSWAELSRDMRVAELRSPDGDEEAQGRCVLTDVAWSFARSRQRSLQWFGMCPPQRNPSCPREPERLRRRGKKCRWDCSSCMNTCAREKLCCMAGPSSSLSKSLWDERFDRRSAEDDAAKEIDSCATIQESAGIK